MTKEELEKILFSEQTFVYAVLDGASVSDLRMKLYELRPNHFCLLRGELEPDMQEVAPYLINLVRGTPFTDWVLSENFGNHWGIFLHSRYSINEMRKHFRALLTVTDEKGDPMLFRYYDPRVLPKFLPTCDSDELKTLFGNVDVFFAETDKGQHFSSFQRQDNELKITEIS